MSRGFPHTPDVSLVTAAPQVATPGPAATKGNEVAPLGNTVYGWGPRATFGPHLRGLRKSLGLSLRKTAEDLGMSYAYLARLETETRSSPPRVDLLLRFAQIYRCDPRALCVEAGFQFERPPVAAPRPELALRDHFRAMVLHPAARPSGMDERQIDMIPAVVQRQWIEFTQKVVRLLHPDPALVENVFGSWFEPTPPPEVVEPAESGAMMEIDGDGRSERINW